MTQRRRLGRAALNHTFAGQTVSQLCERRGGNAQCFRQSARGQGAAAQDSERLRLRQRQIKLGQMTLIMVDHQAGHSFGEIVQNLLHLAWRRHVFVLASKSLIIRKIFDALSIFSVAPPPNQK